MTETTMETIHNNARFTCLAPGLVRMEYSPTWQFEDRNTVLEPDEVLFGRYQP